MCRAKSYAELISNKFLRLFDTIRALFENLGLTLVSTFLHYINRRVGIAHPTINLLLAEYRYPFN
jgi:hypothetical protein